jgi:hypothetical protein
MANGRSTLTGRSHKAASESGHERGWFGADRSSPSGSGRERGRESTRARTRAVAGRWGPPVRRCGRTRVVAGPSWANWAELGFSFSRDFLNDFSFYFL